MDGQKTKKTKKTTIFRYIYIVLTVVVIVLIGALDPNFQGMFEALKELNVTWLIICLVAVFLYWFSDAALLKDITGYMHGKYSIWSAFKVGLIGLYYGALTPSATGGQPMQVVYMRRDNVPTGTGTGIVGVKFVVYELSLCCFYIVSMILRGASFYHDQNEIFWITTLGFVINLALVTFIVLTMVNRRLVNACGSGIIKLCAKIRIIKNPEKAKANFDNTIEEYRKAMQHIKAHKLRVFMSFVISFINLAFLFSISYCVYRAMGFTEATMIDMITMQAFLYLAVSLIPTPGSAGASEGGFYLFFGLFFPSASIFMGMLFWRFLTYYLILFVGSALVVVDEVRMMRAKKQMTS